MSKIEQQLREQIKEELTKVTKANSPNIYRSIFNRKGEINTDNYPFMESRIIYKMINENMPATSAIVQVEMEMDGN